MRNSIKTSLLIAGLLLSVSVSNVSADDRQNVTTGSAYTTLSGSVNNYAFPDGQSIMVYPSIKIGVPLTDGEYDFEETTTKSLQKSTPTAYQLKLTESGQNKINKAFENTPGSYTQVESSKNVYGQFKDLNNQFNTGISSTNEKPSVSNVIYTVTLTADAQNIKSQKELKKLKNQTETDQSDFQKQIGELNKDQQKLITPSATNLSVESNKINENTNPTNAQSSSKKKIVNLAALKLAKNAERIENQKKKDEQHAKIVKNTLIAVATIAILAMAAWAVRYFRKNKKQG